jgi:hypothetical protein
MPLHRNKKRIQTKRRTPTPAKITFAGGSACEGNIRGNFSNKEAF